MRDRRDLIEMYSIWVKPMGVSTEAIASKCADEAIRFAKEYHKDQLTLTDVSQQRELLKVLEYSRQIKNNPKDIQLLIDKLYVENL